MSEAIPPSVNALLKLRKSICAELRSLGIRERSLRSKLVQVDGVLRMLGESDPEIPGRRKRTSPYTKREVVRRVMDVLRNVQEPMGPGQIAILVMEARGLSTDDPDALAFTKQAVAAALRRHPDIVEVGRGGREKLWKLRD